MGAPLPEDHRCHTNAICSWMPSGTMVKSKFDLCRPRPDKGHSPLRASPPGGCRGNQPHPSFPAWHFWPHFEGELMQPVGNHRVDF